MDVGTPMHEASGTRYPASLAQTRFWLLDEMNPGTPALNVAVRWTLLGHVAPTAVEAAWREVVGRHEILRTALLNERGTPVQLVKSAAILRFQHHELAHLPATERAETADRLGEVEARAPFVLEAAPLMRVTLLSLEPGVSRLLLTLHHAVCDGWSIGVLADDFLAALAHAPLPELPLQYGDYALWQQAWLNSPALEDISAYWVRQLTGLPYVSVPPDHPATARGASAIVSRLLPRKLTDEVARIAAEHGCTSFAVALAALGRVLQARTGAEDIAIGTQVASRNEVELETIVGCFINTVVLRLDLTGAPDWNALVGRAAAVVADALQHADMPFEALIRVLNPRRERHRTPLFSVNLIFQRSFVKPAERGGVKLVDLPSHSAGALYDLNFFMVERPDGWRASCEYDTALFERETVEAMLEGWTRALAGGPVAVDAGEPDRSRTLQALAALWCEILGVDVVAPEDSFFDLGGHSLLAARMLARVEEAFGRRIAFADLFVSPTLAGVAHLLKNEPVAPNTEERVPLIALGQAKEWRALSEALGPDRPLACVSQPSAADLTGLHPHGKLAVIGAGSGGAAALTLSRALRALGRAVTLVLIDAPAPPAPPLQTGLWSRLRRAAPLPFDGKTIYFQSAPGHPQTLDWAAHIAAPLEVVPLPARPWEPAVARFLATALA